MAWGSETKVCRSFTLNYIQSHFISLNVYDNFVKVEGINKNIMK